MYLKKIECNNLKNVENHVIDLEDNKSHLALTGKNGSGKTSFLVKMFNVVKMYRDNPTYYNSHKQSITSFNKLLEKEEKKVNKNFGNINEYKRRIKESKEILAPFDDLKFELFSEEEFLNRERDFLMMFFSANRTTNVMKSNGVQKINVDMLKGSGKSNMFEKYLVHLKTQLLYAKEDKDTKEVERIEKWFERIENLMKTIFESKELELIFNRKDYDFDIKIKNKKFKFNELSSGFSSVLNIILEMIVQMEKDEEKLHNYNMPGVVFIDEIESHLHISLQEKIFKILVEFFPNIQFVITTHSPFVLNSVSNSVIYDMELKEEIKDMTSFSYNIIVENYFGYNKHNEKIEAKLKRYDELAFKEKSTIEIDEFYDLRNELVDIENPERFKKKFLEIEKERKNV